MCFLGEGPHWDNKWRRIDMTARAKYVLASAAAALLLFGAACSSRQGGPADAALPGDAVETLTSSPTNTSEPAATNTPASATLSTEQLVELASPSVVRVSLPTGVGSGVIIDPAGYIITNNHVVESAPQSVQVTLADGSIHSAQVLGRDPQADLAVLKIDAGRELPALELADLDDVNVGQDVIAIGFALDLTGGSGPPSVTRGIISALNRAIPSSGILGAVQTDAAINHGNSGGPLLDYEGHVVGINTSLAPDSSTGGLAQNIGFAVGADTIGAVYDEIVQLGFVDRALLGIGGPNGGFAAIRPAEAEALGLDAEVRGVLVGANGVSANGPAAAAGMRGNDLIVRIGDHEIRDETDLAVAMVVYDPGDTVPVEIYRGGELLTLQVTLGASNAQ
jgi:S1-C subfamily serine protease